MELSISSCSSIRSCTLTSASRIKLPATARSYLDLNSSSAAFLALKLPSTRLSTTTKRPHFIWACSKVDAAGTDPLLNKVFQFRDAFWRFLRPHTIRGTTLGSVSALT